MFLKIAQKFSLNIINVIEKHFYWKALIQHLKMDLWFNLRSRQGICQEQRKNSTKKYLQSFLKIKWKVPKQNTLLQFKNKMNHYKGVINKKRLSKRIISNQLITLTLHTQNLD